MRGAQSRSTLTWCATFRTHVCLWRLRSRSHIAPFACSSAKPPGSRAESGLPDDGSAVSPRANDVSRATTLVSLALKATLALSPGGGGASAVGDDALRAFCTVKGLRWGSSGPAAAAERYARSEAAARLRRGELWDSVGANVRVRLLHNVCNGEGEATYIDPETGYTVFAAVAHLRRGHCCGIDEAGKRTHRCRHCPYAPDGSLTSPAMRQLKERIALVDSFREALAKYNADLRRDAPAPVAIAGPSGPANDAEGLAEEKSAAQKGLRSNDPRIGDTSISLAVCEECQGNQLVRCTRCKGWKFLVSPQSRLCPQCDGQGYHSCMGCTAWRPPQRKDFYS